jgi:hypothetical protein
MKREEWDTIRVIIGNEIDEALVNKDKLDSEDMNNLYFEIRKKIEKSIKIED